MKILLIQPPWYGFQKIKSRRLYLGLAYLGAILKKNNHDVLILNGENFFDKFKSRNEETAIDEKDFLENYTKNHYVYNRILEQVSTFQPQAIGISFMTAGSSSAYFLAEKIRTTYPSIPLIAGGWHPTLIPNEPLAKGLFDFCIRGEGEETILELLGAILEQKNFSDILGVSYKSSGVIKHNNNRPYINNLDSLPFPAFELLYDYEKNRLSCSGIITSRGCPFACTYCASKVMWTRKVRFRSPENILAEIKQRYISMGIKNFSFNDDTFTLDKKRVYEICQGIIREKLKIKWHCDTRGDTLDLETLKIMRKADCDHIYLGLESGSEKIQKILKKNIKTETVKKAAQLARKAGIKTTVYFMIGFPDETENDIEDSINAMKDIKPDYAIWSILTLYPGTEIWDLAIKRKLINKNFNWDRCFHHFNQGNIFGSISKKSWDKMLKKIHIEQTKLHNRLTAIKIRDKIFRLLLILKNIFKNPRSISDLPFKILSKIK